MWERLILVAQKVTDSIPKGDTNICSDGFSAVSSLESFNKMPPVQTREKKRNKKVLWLALELFRSLQFIIPFIKFLLFIFDR